MKMRPMSKAVVMVVGVFLSVFVARAQEMPRGGILIEPDGDAFLSIVENIIANAPTYYSFGAFTGGGGKAEWDALIDEIIWRFSDVDTITFEQLITLYRAFAADSFARETDADDRLIPLLIERWLFENPLQVSDSTQLIFDDFVFDVRSLPNTPGISLRVVRAPFDSAALFYQGFSGRTADFIVIRDTDGVYQVPALPERMFGHVIAANDFNSDGQSDFAYQTFEHVGNSFVSGALVIVTWNGTTFQTLGNLPFRYGLDFDHYWNSAVSWQFIRLDEDAQHEIFATQHLTDNFDCHFIRLSFFDWGNDGTIENKGVQDSFPSTFNCLVRQAEERAWQGGYSDAIPLYEAALEQVTEPNTLKVYTQVKLGLAYLVSGQNEQANEIFMSLSAPADDLNMQTWANTLQAAYERDPRLLPMCQTVYQAALDRADPYGLNGFIQEYDGGFDRMSVGMTPPFRVNNVSCDLAAALDSQLAAVTFATDHPPDEQLEALGLTVADSISADFDGDGDADWIVWGNALGLDPILFVAEHERFTTTRLAGRGIGDAIFRAADLRTPDETVLYRVITLPDGNSALVNMDVGMDRVAEIECGSCGGGGPSLVCVGDEQTNFPTYSLGDLTIWQLENAQFSPMFFTLMCPWDIPVHLLPGADGQVVEQFTAGDQFNGGEWIIEIRPVTYTWDQEQQTFIPPPQPTPTASSEVPITTATVSQQIEYPLGVSTYWHLRQAFSERNFAAVLMMLDTALAATAQRDEAYLPAFRYYRALTLEALSRPDEAVAEYITIVSTESASAWAQLASLHIEN